MRWTDKKVAEWVEEAAETHRSLHSVRPQGFKANWPDYTLEKNEAYGLMTKTSEEPNRFVPSAAAIDRFDQVQMWMRWLERIDQKIIWSYGLGFSDRKTAKLVRKDKNTVKRRRVRAFKMIARRLNND